MLGLPGSVALCFREHGFPACMRCTLTTLLASMLTGGAMTALMNAGLSAVSSGVVAMCASMTAFVRELSAAAGDAGFPMSPGFASKVVHALEERRYARRSGGKVLLANRPALLADWAEAYRGMRHPRPAGWYLHAASAERARDAVGEAVGGAGALAGLAAASLTCGYAMFDAVDVYARDLAAVEGAL